jgi:hypothetical protein
LEGEGGIEAGCTVGDFVRGDLEVRHRSILLLRATRQDS